jgi:hypothetical protein
MGEAGKNLLDNFCDHYKFYGKLFTVLPERTGFDHQEAEIMIDPAHVDKGGIEIT